MRRCVTALAVAFVLVSAFSPLSGQIGPSVAVHSGAVLLAADGGPLTAGAVHVFTPSEDGWAETDRITPVDGEPGMGFGSWLAVSGDRMLVGSEVATYVFEYSGGSWEEMASFPTDDVVYAGAISGDAAVITGNVGFLPRGPVRVFQRSGTGWSDVGELTDPTGFGDGVFGAAVAFVGDLLAVADPWAGGEVNEEGERISFGPGAVYLFARAGTGWEQAGEPLEMPGAPDGASFGTSLHTEMGPNGPRLFVGARAGVGGAAAVFEFEYDAEAEEWTAVNSYWPPVTRPATRRGGPGLSITAVADELWIGGLAGGVRGEGEIMRYQSGADGFTAFVGTLGSDSPSDNGRFGRTIAAEGDVAAVTSPGRDNGQGVVHILERDGNAWTQADEVWIEAPNYESIDGTVSCQDGNAGPFACTDVDILSFVPVRELGAERGIRVNDIWGWTDPDSGREYALVGLSNQASFVDVTDPEAPIYLGRLPMPEGARRSSWRDIKVYENHAFIVSDGAGPHGMQVFDLTRLRDVGDEPATFEPDFHYTNIASAHNIVINEATGFAYSVGGGGGGETCGGGLHMIDVRDPKNPTFAGCFSHEASGRDNIGYSHDAMCITYAGPDADYTGRELCFGSNASVLSIADVTDKSNPVPVAVADYPNAAYVHQGWITDDHRYFYLGDEGDEGRQSRTDNPFPGTRTMIWDVTDIDDPVFVGEHFGETYTTDHNMYVVGDLLYQSNYTSGLRILDIADRENPREVGFIDTVPHDESVAMTGSWSNYPYFRSGTIIVTSGGEGLFMVRYRKPIT